VPPANASAAGTGHTVSAAEFDRFYRDCWLRLLRFVQ
jgi:hypothetical protein